ncbi:allergin-1 isoform X2 [Phyllostomus hastatus]|uniref:allergin-1 isoform X2 n=1 Tax=Phyllostomus hastatus TaxID=9423 RepID=UPI001E6805B6|nr:allergin-1 isoform X2 [Phyllostomus hastatus]
MWRKRVFLLLFSLSTLKAEPNFEQMGKTNKLTSPILNSETNIVTKGQNVSIICSSQSKLSPITYSLFRDQNCIGTQDSKGEHVTFNLSISEASDLGPYKCKTQVPSCKEHNCTRYSHEFSFMFVELTSPILNSETNIVMKGQNVSIICSSQSKLLPITYSLFRNKNCIGTQDSKGEHVTFNLSISEASDLGPYKCKTQVPSCKEHNCTRYSHEFSFMFVDPVTTPVLNITRIASHYVTLHCISSNGSLPINYTFFENNITISRVIIKNVREPAEFNLTKNRVGVEKYKCKAENRLPRHVKYSHPITITSKGKARRDKAPKDYGNIPMEVGLYANVCENPGDKESAPGLERRQCVSTAQDETKSSQEIHYATPLFQKVTPQNHEACNKGKTEYIYSEIIL